MRVFSASPNQISPRFGMTTALPNSFNIVRALEAELDQTQPGVAYILYVLKIWADISTRNMNDLPPMNTTVRAAIDRLQDAHNKAQAAQGTERNSITNQSVEDEFLLKHLVPWLQDTEHLPFRVSQTVLDTVLSRLQPTITAANLRQDQR